MAIQYKQNKLYSKLIDVSKSLGQSTRDAKARSAAPVTPTTGAPVVAPTGDISQYQNLPKTLSDLGTVTTPFLGSTRYEPGGTHKGLDIANRMGTPIPSFTGGTVTDVRTGQSQGSPDYGNYVIITTPQGDKVRYSHLSNDFVPVVGQRVKQGDVIGQMSNTGQTYSRHGGDASHLDLRIQTAYNNQYVNPETYLSNYQYE